jgi:hypothetical protein
MLMKIWTLSASQNDRLNLDFVKDIDNSVIGSKIRLIKTQIYDIAQSQIWFITL